MSARRLAAAMIVALPIVAHRIDDSADEFTSSHFAFGVAVGWALCALLTAVAVTRRVQIKINIEEAPDSPSRTTPRFDSGRETCPWHRHSEWSHSSPTRQVVSGTSPGVTGVRINANFG